MAPGSRLDNIQVSSSAIHIDIEDISNASR